MDINNWDLIVKKSVSNIEYKNRLLTEPNIVLAEEGVLVPEGVTVHVVESTPTEVWLILPNHRESVKFLSPYVAVCEVNGVEVQGCDPKNAKILRQDVPSNNPASAAILSV
ncbi:NHLP leader peptide family RiPP precursor [Desulfovibrio sp. DV]|uniref:NHLP leader peptide family RiPP precursor n=1 Tax=Desulfovibrio sp. DV TaxID=1844708 RepID=UPI00094B7B9A|nr:NHLP leader peptide family RiPP precursor [Desulfovibrio sp. DV]